jgi:hypothetical protein
MIGWWGINKMNYKQMPEYKELLSFGFVDITDQYKSTKPNRCISTTGRDTERTKTG